MFTDLVELHIKAGKGGDGRLSFRSLRGNARGGPDGGDGGDGGNVIAVADHNTNTLSKYRNIKQWQAEAGEAGGSNRRHGRKGQDIYLPVPPGTVVSDGELILADLAQLGDEAIIAHGGRGGFGNAHFKSSVRQAPRLSELGEPGEELTLKFELKLVADVGLVGLPNAGKSTLLSAISAAKPEIADYPFTTLNPNLGVVDVDQSTFLVADIPGLIEGASQGKGLGDEFLRHVERTRVLLHLIDATSDDLASDYATIQKELKDYKADLSNRPQFVVLAKVESLPKKDLEAKIARLIKFAKLKKSQLFAVSSIAKIGLQPLLRATVKLLNKIDAKASTDTDAEMPVIRLDETKVWDVRKKGDAFEVTGTEIEGFAKRTNFAQYQAVQRLRHILEKKGALKQVQRLGGGPGSTIRIGSKEIQW